MGDCSASASGTAVPTDASFRCPFPGCKRQYLELWKLRQHCRAPPRASSRQGGHGCELQHCPKCSRELSPSQPHLGCLGGLAAPRQAVKRRRMQSKKDEERSTRRAASAEPLPPLLVVQQAKALERSASDPAIPESRRPRPTSPQASSLLRPAPDASVPASPSPLGRLQPQHSSTASTSQQEADLAAACLQAVAENPAALARIKAAASQSQQQAPQPAGPQAQPAARLPIEQLVAAFVRAIMETQQAVDETLAFKPAEPQPQVSSGENSQRHSSNASHSAGFPSPVPPMRQPSEHSISHSASPASGSTGLAMPAQAFSQQGAAALTDAMNAAAIAAAAPGNDGGMPAAAGHDAMHTSMLQSIAAQHPGIPTSAPGAWPPSAQQAGHQWGKPPQVPAPQHPPAAHNAHNAGEWSWLGAVGNGFNGFNADPQPHLAAWQQHQAATQEAAAAQHHAAATHAMQQQPPPQILAPPLSAAPPLQLSPLQPSSQQGPHPHHQLPQNAQHHQQQQRAPHQQQQHNQIKDEPPQPFLEQLQQPFLEQLQQPFLEQIQGRLPSVPPLATLASLGPLDPSDMAYLNELTAALRSGSIRVPSLRSDSRTLDVKELLGEAWTT